jgi:hypothetical protein
LQQEGWDLAGCLTDLPVYRSDSLVVADVSERRKVAGLSLPDEDMKNTDVDARFTAPGVQPEMVERGWKREKLKEKGKGEVN